MCPSCFGNNIEEYEENVEHDGQTRKVSSSKCLECKDHFYTPDQLAKLNEALDQIGYGLPRDADGNPIFRQELVF